MMCLSMSGGNGEHLKPERVRQDVRVGPDEEVAAQRADAITPPAAGPHKMQGAADQNHGGPGAYSVPRGPSDYKEEITGND